MLHIETDCSYTLIVVPLSTNGINGHGDFVFEFLWNRNEGMIQLALEKGTVLYYCGYEILHHQISLIDKVYTLNDYNFCNLSSCGNKHLYDNAMKTFQCVIAFDNSINS